MRHVFARRPVAEFENYSNVHLGAGEKYQKRFTENPGRALMWELEQSALRDIVGTLKPRRALDFACGTGRISCFLESAFPELQIEGIDISESMVEIARQRAKRVTYRIMSSDQALAAYGRGAFDMVLAFRFFANAEPALRERIGADLGPLVSDGGSLVINNHRNFWSTSYLARRAAGQEPIGALNEDIERIFRAQGFRVVRKLSLGLWPQGDAQALLLPWKAVRLLERANLRGPAAFHSLGYNTIWVLSR